MLLQLTVFAIAFDAWNYWSHRLMHYGVLYKKIHKVHHLYKTPFSFAAEYISPYELSVAGFGAVGLPMIWVRLTGELHLVTFCIWMMFVLFQSMDGHSGYDFPWGVRHFVPIWAGPRHHDLHHQRVNGNYGSVFWFWDYFMDTLINDDAIERRRRKILAERRFETRNHTRKSRLLDKRNT